MTGAPPNVALYFDADAYTEAHRRAGNAQGPAGLMGRQVAGKEFLDAFLAYSRSEALSAVVRAAERAEPLVRLCANRPSNRERLRTLSIQTESAFLTTTQAPVDILHFPFPPDARFAWARQANGLRFAMSGVTHTLSTRAAVQTLRDLVLAPFAPHDALICTSRAVAEMVRAVTGAFVDYLKDRFGAARLLPRLEVIPLGVHPERFRPATANERAVERGKLGAGDDETIILCVGRLSHHAKAHPFPVFHAAEKAARRTGNRLRLVFSGWAAHPAIDQAFRDGARQFAPSVAVTFVDGLDRAVRAGVWRAADVFVSLPDNIQETFGLVVVEAMASGLPVVGSDWNGYRDLIADGVTGYLIPTRMVRGATQSATSRYLFADLNYDHFLAQCSQAVVVDPTAAADALTQLVSDPPLRRSMGAAGRERALRHFTWEHVVRAYESLWAEQEAILKASRSGSKIIAEPVQYPPPEQSFAGYPTHWLSEMDRVKSADRAGDALATFLDMPLTNLMADCRCNDRASLNRLLEIANGGASIGELVAALASVGIGQVEARATIAWLMKYGLLFPLSGNGPDNSAAEEGTHG